MRQRLTYPVLDMMQDVPSSWYGKKDRAAFWFLTNLMIQGNNLTGVCLHMLMAHTLSSLLCLQIFHRRTLQSGELQQKRLLGIKYLLGGRFR